MNIALYMDVNVRAEITRQLRAREVDVLISMQLEVPCVSG